MDEGNSDSPISIIVLHRLSSVRVDRPSANVSKIGNGASYAATLAWTFAPKFSLHISDRPQYFGYRTAVVILTNVWFDDNSLHWDLKKNEIKTNNVSPMKRSRKEYSYVCRFVRSYWRRGRGLSSFAPLRQIRMLMTRSEPDDKPKVVSN
jgi:hypothetical protein